MKKCTKCGETKTEDSFYKRSDTGKLRNECRKCWGISTSKWQRKNHEKRRAICKRWGDKNREKERERMKKYHADNPEQVRKYNEEYRRKYPERVTAYNLAQKNIKKRQPCSVCGMSPAEKHHEDYTKPLEVTWLCKAHHQQLHARRRNGSLV